MTSKNPSDRHDITQHSILVSYCLDTGLHGLKYVGQPKRHAFERLFWIIAFVASLTTSAVLITWLYKDYKDNPIITVFNPVQQTLDNIPFPSITVCNLNPLPVSAYSNQFMKSFGSTAVDFLKLKEKEDHFKTLARLADIFQICDSSPSFVEKFRKKYGNALIEDTITEIKNAVQQDGPHVMRHMNPKATLQNMAQPCAEMIIHCVWQGKITNCSELFTDVYTDFGRCCTFNTIPESTLMNHVENQSLDWGALTYDSLLFTEKTKGRKLPARQKYPGRSAGLSFMLDPNIEEYMCPSLDGEGFVMGINVPLDSPRIRDSGVVFRTHSETFIGVKPHITMADETVKSFSLNKRQCYQGNDHTLDHYTKYTVSNCMNECIAKETMKRCGCLRYYMPGGEGMKLCKLERFNCTIEVEADILEHGITGSCSECWPTCTEIVYDHEISSLGLHKEQIDKLHTFLGQKMKNPTVVHVFMDSSSVFSKLRKEMTSRTQLLSNAGGLLGLCMGFSMLSLLEIIYYASIRPLFSYMRKKQEMKSLSNLSTSHTEGAPNKLNQTWTIVSKIIMKEPSTVGITGTNFQSNTSQIVWKKHNDQKLKQISEASLPPYYYSGYNDKFNNYRWQ